MIENRPVDRQIPIVRNVDATLTTQGIGKSISSNRRVTLLVRKPD